MSIELYLSIAGIVIIVVTIVTGLEIRKISKEIIDIEGSVEALEKLEKETNKEI